PKRICSGNGTRDSDGNCVCDSGLFTGSQCQVTLQFEGLYEPDWNPFAEPGPAITFLSGKPTVFGPVLPPGDKYSFTVEITDNHFPAINSGIQVGVAAPSVGASGQILGRMDRQWAYDSGVARFWNEGV